MSYRMDDVRHIGNNGRLGVGGMSSLTFTTKVMPIFGLALAMAAAGVYLGAGLPMGYLYGAMGVELLLVFTSGLWQRKEGLNNILFFVYALLSGVTLVPLLAYAQLRGGDALIIQALAVTTVTFGGCAAVGLTTKRDLSGMGGFLVMTCIGLLVAILANTFLFHSSILTLVTSVLGVAMFSAFTTYDMNRVRNAYSDADYVGAALALFIDFIGLFTFILRLFGLSSSRDD